MVRPRLVNGVGLDVEIIPTVKPFVVEPGAFTAPGAVRTATRHFRILPCQNHSQAKNRVLTGSFRVIHAPDDATEQVDQDR